MPAIDVVDLAKTYRYHHKESGLLGSVKSLLRRETLEKRAVDGISFVALASLALYLSHRFWNFAVRHYSSASS